MENAELKARLREAAEAELLELVSDYAEALDPGAARLALKNSYAGREVIEVLLRQRRLLSAPEVRREIVGHPATPEPQALNLLPGLFWRDLVKLGSSVRTRPRIRRAAEQRLINKLPTLSVGERVTIARKVGPGAMTRLRNDANPRVIGALLDNPRLTEGVLAPLLTSETASPQVLERIAEDRRWGLRYGVKVMLARNPRTPVSTAISLLSSLKKRDLSGVANDWRIAAPVRQRANLLLGRL